MESLAAASLARWREGEALLEDEDLVAREVPVALTVNRRSHVVMMATPIGLEAFALGFGLTEGLLQDRLALRALRSGHGSSLADWPKTMDTECLGAR